MVVTSTGRPIGSLSAGCVETVVIDSALEVIASGDSVTQRFGYADAEAIEVGLTCGGEVEVYIERVDASRKDQCEALIAAHDAGQPIALITTTGLHSRWRLQSLDSTPSSDLLDADARALLRAGRSGIIGTDECETPDIGNSRARAFVHSLTTPPRMILAGANDFVRALGAAAMLLEYRVTVVDARPVFTTVARFPHVDEVVVDWPHRYLAVEYAAGRLDDRTVVCVMTHDPKFDVPMLAAALGMETLAFVGALGSRRTHADRIARLFEAGVTTDQVRKLNSPLGLDLGAHSPEETAVSILAQLIAQCGNASGRPLRDMDGPIHGSNSTVTLKRP
jgi:xanthine dehydrogenase accessory factor